MRKLQSIIIFSVTCLVALPAGPAVAQQKAGAMVCWKDKAGKTVGCGDKVPPEYQDNANSTLNQRGMMVNKSEAAVTPEQRQAQKAEGEQKKLDAQKREEEGRRDRVLLDSFTTDKEIDLKRARDIQHIEINLAAQQSNINSMTGRLNETQSKMNQFKKENKPVPAVLQQDFDRLTADLAKNQALIVQKRKEIAEKNLEYDAMKKRFMELKSGTATQTAATAAPAAPPPRK